MPYDTFVDREHTLIGAAGHFPQFQVHRPEQKSGRSSTWKCGEVSILKRLHTAGDHQETARSSCSGKLCLGLLMNRHLLGKQGLTAKHWLSSSPVLCSHAYDHGMQTLAAMLNSLDLLEGTLMLMVLCIFSQTSYCACKDPMPLISSTNHVMLPLSPCRV